MLSYIQRICGKMWQNESFSFLDVITIISLLIQLQGDQQIKSMQQDLRRIEAKLDLLLSQYAPVAQLE